MRPDLRVTREDLLAGFRSVGIERGDVVYVASSLGALGLMENPVESTLQALREAVGPEGTLVMPAFNFGFCRGEAFDRENTPADTGVLAEAFRRLPEARRSWSPPFHTVVAAGARADEIAGIVSTTSFGRTSVFQHLHDIGARHLLIGCGYHDGVAHFHWLEELHEVPYRYWKKFRGPVVLDGRAEEREFFMFARRPGSTLRADPLGERFEASGAVRRADVGLCRLRAFDLRAFARFFDPLFREDPLCLLDPEARGRFTPRTSPVVRLDHIAIASRYADKIRELLALIPYVLQFEANVPELGVHVEVLDGPSTKIELVNPAREGSVVDRHIERNPTCPLHHLAFEVDDLDRGVAFFGQRGYQPLDGRVLDGAEPGQKVIFLSPVLTGGLLVELVANRPTLKGDVQGCSPTTSASV